MSDYREFIYSVFLRFLHKILLFDRRHSLWLFAFIRKPIKDQGTFGVIPKAKSLFCGKITNGRCFYEIIGREENKVNFLHSFYLSFHELLKAKVATGTALLKVDFRSRSHSRVPDLYSTVVEKSTLSRINPTVNSTPPRRSDPYANQALFTG